MHEVLKIMMERRSIRSYTEQQVPEDVLEQILTAASYSPNAGNRQTTRLVVCQNGSINDTLGKIHRLLFMKYKTEKSGETILLEPGDLEKPGLESSFYGAPTVISLFGIENFVFADADSYIMANNICTAAYSLGVGSCIIGVVTVIFNNEYGKRLLGEWDIPSTYRVRAHVILGYPAEGFSEPKPRTYVNPVLVR